MSKTAKRDMGKAKNTGMVRYPGGVSKAKSEHPRYPYVVRWPGPDGKRLAKFFTNDTDALTWAKDKSSEAGQLGSDFGTVGEDERAALAFWRGFMDGQDPAPPALLSVLQDYAHRWKAHREGATVAATVPAFIAAKEAEGLSLAHLGTVRVRLGRFERDFATRHLASFTQAELSDYILGLRGPVLQAAPEAPAPAKRGRKKLDAPRATRREALLSATTRKGYRATIGSFFEWAKKRGMIETNPCEDAATPKAKRKIPGILRPADMKAFFAALCDRAPVIVPFWAVRAFAGIREAEAVRMSWEMVSLAKNEIHLPGTVTKTGRPRTIAIQPALAAFLAPHAKKSGPLCPLTPMARRWHLRLAKRAIPKVKLPANFARHSYATYHLEAFRHAGETSLQLGHGGNPEMLNSHYKGIATEAEAAQFWAIRPDTLPEPENVVAMHEPAPAADKPGKPKRKVARQ